MKKCLLSGNFALDTIVVREYPDGFFIGKNNSFFESIINECVGNTCGNVCCILPILGVQSYPIAHFDLSTQGQQIKQDLLRYGADTRFVENSERGGTTLMRCTHKRDKHTGHYYVSCRATSPGSIFPKRKYLRGRDEAPAFLQNLDFVPDVFFFDVSEAGLRVIARHLKENGTLVFFEPESDYDIKKLIKGIEVSDIIKFSSERIQDNTLFSQYPDKLFIRTSGNQGLDFSLRRDKWIHIDSIPNPNAIDWEGAGDIITSVLIASLCHNNILSVNDMTSETISEFLNSACKVASFSGSYYTSKGIIDALIKTHASEPIWIDSKININLFAKI